MWLNDLDIFEKQYVIYKNARIKLQTISSVSATGGSSASTKKTKIVKK
jgi:hypothetical protein